MFEESGSITVHAVKESDTRSYLPAETDVTVKPDTVSLSLYIKEDYLNIGDKITVQVQDDTDEGISGATVEAFDEKSDMRASTKTDTNGKATLILDHTGKYTIAARGPPDSIMSYEPDNETVKVYSESTGLALIPNQREVSPDTEVKFTVRDSFGDRVESAIVRSKPVKGVSGPIKEAKSDSRGIVSIRFESKGEYKVQVETEHDVIDYEYISVK